MHGRRTFFACLAVAASLFWLWAVNHWHKLASDSHWWGVPIWIIAAAVFGLTLVVGYILPTFSDPQEETPTWFVIGLVAGILLCTFLGVYFTEPLERGGESRQEMAQAQATPRPAYDYGRSRSGGWVFLHFGSSGSSSGSSSSSGGSSSSGSSSSKDAEGICFLFVLLAIVLLIVGSAFIPHLWVVAVAFFAAIAILLAVRETKLEQNRANHW